MEQKQNWLTGVVAAFNRHYPTFLEAIIGTGDVLQALTQTVIVAFGSLVVLFLLLVVEHQRVMYGIALFETNGAFASFAAWALVLINLVIEFQIVHIDTKAGYKARQARGSLRFLLSDLGYRLGFGKHWKAQGLPQSHVYRRLSGFVTWTILALALAGSMREMITQQTGVWYQALVSIFTESSLSNMLTWTGGFFFAATAVFGAQGIAYYTGMRVIEIKRQMVTRKQQATRQTRAIQRLSETPYAKPVWGEHRRDDLAPLKIKVAGGKTRYQCPNCGKQMSRQAWQNHPCRLTVVASQIDGVDKPLDTLTVVDNLDNTVDGQPVKQSVNGHVKSVNL